VASRETMGETASLGIFLDAGIRSESPETAGTTNLLEQLAYMGTAKKPQQKFEQEIESIGGALSVSMGREQSSFMMTVAKPDAKQAVDILADMVTGPAIATYEKEKAALIRKLEDTEKPTRAVIDDRLHLCAFRDSSLGLSTIGPYEDIDKITTGHLKSYVDANYTAEKMVVATSGIKHDEAVKLAEASLGGVKTGPPPTYQDVPYFCGAELLYRNDEMGPVAYTSIGWQGVPWKSPDAVTMMVMAQVIGSYKKDTGLVPGNISGNRTTNAMANKMDVGCADEYECFAKFYKDTGVFGWYAACDEVAVEHCVGELMFYTAALSHSVTDEEVERGKRELKVKLFGGDGSTTADCAEIGEQILAYGRGIPAAEMILRINAVDAEEVKRVAWTYLADKEIAVTGLGPLHGMASYLDLTHKTVMHRY